jgi:hypothetical protein
MSVSRETLNEHRNRLYQGALYLVDNPGEPLPGATATKAEIRDFEDRAIALHLAKHTYYSQKVRGATFEPVDADGMRRQVGYLYTRGATPSTKEKKPSDQNAVDRVFYTGTEGLKTDFLESYNYDKATFSEADLPAHRENEEEEANVVNDDLKQSSGDAEASEDASKGGDEHSNKDKGKNNVVEGGKQDNTDRTGRLPEVGQGPGVQSGKNDDVQFQSVDAIRLARESVDETPEPKGKGKALGSSTELKKRPRDPKEDGAPAERSSKVSRLTHAESSTAQAEHPLPTTETQHASAKTPTDTTPQEDAVVASDSQVQQPIELDTSVLTKELRKLDKDLLQVTEAVLHSIMETPFQYPSSLDPDPPQRLLNLYVRCWGEDWEAVRLRLTRQYLFVMPQVVKALVSAFLYDNILDGEASLLDDLAKLRHTASLDGSGETVRHYLQSEQCWSDLKASAHAFRATQDRARLSQNEADTQAQFKAEADKITADLWTVIVPHFRGLSEWSRLYGESTGQPEDVWMEVFKSGMTGIVQETLHHRLRLVGTGCEFTYTWPSVGDVFDPVAMRMDNNMPILAHHRQSVLHTVFPGLEVIAPDLSRETLYICSTVKVRQTPWDKVQQVDGLPDKRL